MLTNILLFYMKATLKTHSSVLGASLLSYIIDEVKRDYMLEFNEKKLRERRKRVYTFMKTPRELEKVGSLYFYIY